MHFLLCLVVQLMDGYPFVEDVSGEKTTMKKPGSMSLANVVRILWQRLKLISETLTQNMVREWILVEQTSLNRHFSSQIKSKDLDNSSFGNRSSRGCQASGSLSYCESCSCAGKAIRHLTCTISTALQDCNLSSVIIDQR